MPRHEERLPLLGSLFAKLMAIMLVMALCLLLMVILFFRHIVDPGVGGAIARVLGAYAESIAATSPDLEAARREAERIGMTVSYEGPRGQWTTEGSSPGPSPAAEGDKATGRFTKVVYKSFTATRILVGGPDGKYTFSWEFSQSIRTAHQRLVLLLLLLMLSVVFAAHQLLRFSLRPVRLLYSAVGRVGAGELDVCVPRQSSDELGALTDAFNQMARRVREMIVLRDQLLLDVSHELRSPLTRMKVALELMREGEMRSRITADVAEMEALVGGILELERLRDGRGIRLERVDLVALVREVASLFEGSPPGVKVVAPPEPVLLDLDPDRVRMLLRNLLGNAIKYSLSDSGRVEVTVSPKDGGVLVAVKDDGPGIAREDLENVFEPFYRSDRSRSKKTGGFGLGLSICKRVMVAHGGTIEAQNNPGRGVSILLSFRSSGRG